MAVAAATDRLGRGVSPYDILHVGDSDNPTTAAPHEAFEAFPGTHQLGLVAPRRQGYQARRFVFQSCSFKE